MSLVRSLRRWRHVMAAVLLAISTIMPQAAQASTVQWQATVGSETTDEAIQGNGFFPRQFVVNVGDSVTWAIKTGEIHTVTFLSGTPRPDLLTSTPGGLTFNPVALLPAGGSTYDGTGYVNAGILPIIAPSFTLTFRKPGVFDYVCLVHSTMRGTVRVRPAGTPYPHDQAFYDGQGQQQRDRLLALGAHVEGQGLQAARVSAGPAVTAGTGRLLGNATIAVVRFLPDPLTIHVGDTVVWTNRDPEFPHTVTFGQDPGPSPFDAYRPSANVRGGQATLSAPGQSVNSGFLGADPRYFGTQFSVTFTAPGTYAYFCALHDDLGMKGTIVVQPAAD